MNNYDKKEAKMHPYLVYFANKKFGCYSKTIVAQPRTGGRDAGENKWIHPDIVGFRLTRNNFENRSMQSFYRNMNQDIPYLYSFELKHEVRMSDLKEYYFQAVSNSSWANEGYLVVAMLDKANKNLMNELERLTQAFGIGVILLNLEDIETSEILFEAKKKMELDVFTINNLIEKNSDFLEFIKVINACFQIRDDKGTVEANIAQRMDPILTLEDLKSNYPIMKSEKLIVDEKPIIQTSNPDRDNWYSLDFKDFKGFTGMKPSALKIHDEEIEISTWKDVLIETAKYCKTFNQQVFLKKCFKVDENNLLFLCKNQKLWIKHPRYFKLIEDGIHVNVNLSAEAICKKSWDMYKDFNVDTDQVRIKLQ